MSFLGRIRRLFAGTVSYSDLTAPTAWLTEWGAGGITSAGRAVSPESAMTVSAYFAALRAISEDFGKLPASARSRRADGGSDEATTNGVHRLVHDEFNPLLGAATGKEMLLHYALGWGNGFAQIVRDNSNRPAELWPIHPTRVAVKARGREVWYEVRPEEGGEADIIWPGDMFHLRGLGDMLAGYSIARLARESIGLTGAAENFGASFFGNDATMGMAVTTPADLKETNRKALEKNLGALKDKKFKFVVLPGGVKPERLMVPPEDIQFLETRQFQVEEIARWFRIPPHKLQHLLRATFSNIEHQSIEYVQDTLMPWITRFEQECQRKLFGPDSRSRMFVKVNVNAILRGDYKTRTEGYRSLITTGMLTPNEGRAFEDMNPSTDEGMDRYWIQGAMVPVESAAKKADEPPPPPPAAAPPPPPDGEQPPEDSPPAEEGSSSSARFFPLFMDAASRCVRRERHALAQKKRSAGDRAYSLWVGKFYIGHRAYVEEALAPLYRVLGEPPKAVLSGWLDVWQESSVAAARSGDVEPEQVAAERLALGAMEILG